MEVLLFLALLAASILIGSLVKSHRLRKLTDEVTGLMVKEHFGATILGKDLEKFDWLKKKHPQLYSNAQLAARLIVEHRLQQMSRPRHDDSQK
jgi:hypothetical protein